MFRRVTLLVFLLTIVAVHLGPSTLRAQRKLRPRRLAPGVLTAIPPSPQEEETFSGPVPLQLKELVEELATLDLVLRKDDPDDDVEEVKRKYMILEERAKHVILRRQIFNLEFAFKPLRTIMADVPQPNGVMKKKLVWYMIYRIRNVGNALVPTPKDDKFGPHTIERSNVLPRELMSDKFYPIVVFEGWVENRRTKQYERVPYTDRLLPSYVIKQIQNNEALPAGVLRQVPDKNDPELKLYNSVKISLIRIPLSDATTDNSVWGIVTWEDLDPRIDYLTIYVEGLTNAFRFYEDKDKDGEFVYEHKALQLNFWRPGDDVEERADKVRFGVPLVTDIYKQAKLFEFYRVPGPLLAVYEVDERTNKETPRFKVDAQLDAKLDSVMRTKLINGEFPAELRKAFENKVKGISLDGVIPEVKIEKAQWEFKAQVDDVPRLFRIRYEPRYWEKSVKGLEFKERVDHFWVYR